MQIMTFPIRFSRRKIDFSKGLGRAVREVSKRDRDGIEQVGGAAGRCHSLPFDFAFFLSFRKDSVSCRVLADGYRLSAG